MSNKILVTDSLFIFDEHVKQLEAAGFEVERLDKPEATEDELCEAVKGKVGYILGGVETITDKVVEAADELKAIVFTGTGYGHYVKGYDLATQKGIAIANAPYFNAHSVAECGMMMSLLMCRDAISLARGGPKTFETTHTLSEFKIGIFGLGHVGSEYARMAKAMGVETIGYFGRTRKPELEAELGVTFHDKRKLMSQSDLLFMALPTTTEQGFFAAEDIQAIKPGSTIISICEPQQFNLDALYERLSKREIRAAFDDITPEVKIDKFLQLPLDVYYTPNASVAYNTRSNLKATSDSCVQTMINLLRTGKDQYRTN